MAASYATAPTTWSFSSSGAPTDNISAVPSGSNLKLVVALTTRDTETWTIGTFTVGGQSPSTTFTEINQGACKLRLFEFDQSTIDSFSGVAIAYSDGAEYISPMGINHYYVKDTDQTASVAATDSANGTSVAPVTSGNVAGDLVVGIMALADDAPTIDSWDTLTENQQQDDGAILTSGIASSASTTDTTHTFTHDGSALNIGAYVIIHKAIANTIPVYTAHAMYNMD